MVPGLAGSPNVDGNSLYPDDLKSYDKGDIVPVVEFNEYDANLIGNSYFYNNPKPIHTYQYAVLRAQGLEKDPIRGAISSSSQRETPSMVFGISTPGRPYKNDPADDINYLSNILANTLPPDWDRVPARKGGHQFVMDDGAPLGEDQLVRLRTARGHQIMMHDTENTLYISHADGTSWIEMTKEGDFKIYTKGSFSVRAEGNMNFHSDSNINFNSGGDIKFKAGNKFQVESIKTTLLTGQWAVETSQSAEFKVGNAFNVQTGGSMSFKSGVDIALTTGGSILQNSGGDKEVAPVALLKTLNHADTKFDSITGRWINSDSLLNTIVTVAPSHEPYKRAGTPRFYLPESDGVQPQATYTGAVDAIKNVSGTGVTNPAGIKDLRNQPPASGTVGNLSKDQMTAYLAQIGASESGGDYTSVNSLGYVGKYQFGLGALKDQGYIKSSVTSLSQLDNPNSWTGKDGITNKSTWLNNSAVQESAMMIYTQNNYTAMVANGAITADMPPEEVGGMLATSHLLGATGAKNWRNGSGGADAFGTTGDQYFQKGKYAISVLAPQTAAVNNG
jgi:hypothetical protein